MMRLLRQACAPDEPAPIAGREDVLDCGCEIARLNLSLGAEWCYCPLCRRWWHA